MKFQGPQYELPFVYIYGLEVSQKIEKYIHFCFP